MSNFRSKRLLVACRDITCTWPLPHDCGYGSEACHSNQLKHGKSMGMKAHDYRVAAMCHTAHMELDQGKNLTKKERRDAWNEAHLRTIGELFDRGILKVAGDK